MISQYIYFNLLNQVFNLLSLVIANVCNHKYYSYDSYYIAVIAAAIVIAIIKYPPLKISLNWLLRNNYDNQAN